ncbi:uncharacterized protein LOC141718711 [Apium graveolens]|uniref:uncharacterized protein LOC141718711 n=1 Tax=Apium graveolens TaxID=4045 RepID=UPI003D7AB74C
MESIEGYKYSRRDDRSKRPEKYDYPSRSINDRRDNRKDSKKEFDRGVEQRRDRDSVMFTFLKVPISKILKEIKGKLGFIRPEEMKVKNHKTNPDKYKYHQDKGHSIGECYHLKKLIDRIIKEGGLNQLIQDLRDKLGLKNNREEEPERRDIVRVKVKVIYGGSVLKRDNKTAKEMYFRQMYNLYQFSPSKQHMLMTFSTEDYENVICPHKYSQIINPLIGQNNIWKVLADTGSSTNILFHKIYRKRNLVGEQLEPCDEVPLYTFGGHPIQFEGTITVPVLLVKIPYIVDKRVKFYVVQIESPYNAIIGRPFLSTFIGMEKG